MPNWCENKLTANGSKKDLNALMKYVKGKTEDGAVLEFDFEKVIPTPKELLLNDSPISDKKLKEKFLKKYGTEDWYSWRLKNWDTKWNLAPEDEWLVGKKAVNISFHTAWSPPINIVRLLSKKFPKLSFLLTFCEPGMAFAGEYFVKGGEEHELCFQSGGQEKEYNRIAEKFGLVEEVE